MRSVRWAMLLCVLMIFDVSAVNAGTYSDTVEFNPDTYKGWLSSWQHTLSEIPSNEVVTSADIEVRVQVWSWGSGWYPPPTYRIPLLASDSTFFTTDNAHIVTNLTTSTHPHSSSFYNISASLKSNQLAWLADGNNIYFGLQPSIGGSYYMDYATLNVQTSTAPEPISSTLFIIGGIAMAGRVYQRRKR